MIDTAERRRAAIDFGKGPRGTGMPIPAGIIGTGSRSHVLNLYPGIVAVPSFFFFWRSRHIARSNFQARSTATSTWGKGVEAGNNIFSKAQEVKDS